MARRRRRGKKARVMWTGLNQMTTQVTGGVISAFTLWDPVLYPELAVGNVILERIVGNVRFQQNLNANPLTINWYMGVFDTDATDTVPGAIIPSPSLADVDTIEKKDLWLFGSARLGIDQTSAMGQFDLPVNTAHKARIGGNKAVLFVVEGTGAVANNFRVNGSLRLLAKLP